MKCAVSCAFKRQRPLSESVVSLGEGRADMKMDVSESTFSRQRNINFFSKDTLFSLQVAVVDIFRLHIVRLLPTELQIYVFLTLL